MENSYRYDWIFQISKSRAIVKICNLDGDIEKNIPKFYLDTLFDNVNIIDDKIILDFDYEIIHDFCDFSKLKEQLYNLKNFLIIAKHFKIKKHCLINILDEIFSTYISGKYTITESTAIDTYVYSDICFNYIPTIFPDIINNMETIYQKLQLSITENVIKRIFDTSNSAYSYDFRKKREMSITVNILKMLPIEVTMEKIIPQIMDNYNAIKISSKEYKNIYKIGYRISILLLELFPKQNITKRFIENYIMSIDPIVCRNKDISRTNISEKQKDKIRKLIIKNYHNNK